MIANAPSRDTTVLYTFLSGSRSGAFITAERIRLWSVALLLAYILAIVFLFATAHGINDYKGRPLGSDFSNVYTAGTFVNHGAPTVPFDPIKQYAGERAIFGHATPFYGWHYPPFFLLIAAPLAQLPYVDALIIWQAVSFALYLAGLYVLSKRMPAYSFIKSPNLFLAAAAFPAVFVNLTHGHNGFLTAALFASALATLDSQPVLSGLFFGLIAYKPQFAVLVPVVLVATGRWSAFLSAAFTIACLAALTTVCFGLDVWQAFLGSAHFTQTVVLETGSFGFYKMQSVFGAVRMLGGSVRIAYVIQFCVAAATALLVAKLWRSGTSAAVRGAALLLSIFLVTPYSLDYDLMALAPAIVLLVGEGLANGFRPYEKTILAALWLVPLFARGVAEVTSIPVGLILITTTLVFLLTRGMQDAVSSDCLTQSSVSA